MIKYESSPRESTEINIQAGPSSVNIQRLFEAHTITSKTKQKEKPKENPKTQKQQAPPLTQHQQKTHQHRVPLVSKEKNVTEQKGNTDLRANQRPARVGSAELTRRPSQSQLTLPPVEHTKPKTLPAQEQRKPLRKTENVDKENIPAEKVVVPQPPKSKMWIRPKSASQATRKSVRKTDPVSLYQAYQKDWEKFKSNICESSHSDLRWTIREKMMGNH